MDRLTRYLCPRRRPNAGPDDVAVPTRLTWRRQAMDLGIVGATLFAAIIVLNESANRQWSVAMGPSYQKGQQYALVAANWAQRKLNDAKDSFQKGSSGSPAAPHESVPDVMLAMEDVEDAPRLEDRSIEVEGDSASVPTVGTLRLQQVGRSRTIRSRPVETPDVLERYESKAGPAIDDFPVHLRLE